MRRLAAPLAAALLGGLIAAACAPALGAPPHLIAAWPAAGTSLPVDAHTFELTFNRSLSPDATWAAVWRDEDGSPIDTEAFVDRWYGRRLRLRILRPESGDFRMRWHAVSASTGRVADGEQAFSMLNESTDAPRVRVGRPSAESGDKVELVGNGFTRDCPVWISIGDDDQPLSTVQTNARGTFVTHLSLPSSVPFGLQPITAVDSCGDSATAALQVRWGGWPPLVAFTVGQPGPRSGEATFSLTMRNRSDYVLEHVRVLLHSPAGATFVAAEPTPRQMDGAVLWEIPMVDRGVAGPFRVTYRVNGGTTTHASIEFRHRRPRGCSGDECLPAFVSETTSDSTPVYPLE